MVDLLSMGPPGRVERYLLAFGHRAVCGLCVFGWKGPVRNGTVDEAAQAAHDDLVTHLLSHGITVETKACEPCNGTGWMPGEHLERRCGSCGGWGRLDRFVRTGGEADGTP